MIRFEYWGRDASPMRFPPRQAASANIRTPSLLATCQKPSNSKNAIVSDVAYGSYEAMLSDPLVDCVYVATPHGCLHYAQMMQILQANKHILCGKSLHSQRQTSQSHLPNRGKENCS
ncbi:MAG: Gfo/Idh/MocA family oxidoreductase [Bacillus subtilis]|nr:Gfo/Idh/MocA family oxidoreductase [Bacillus subtilis]